MNDDQIERAARVAYLTGMVSYARMTPLSPDLEALVKEPSWRDLEPSIKEHWREIARAVIAAAV